MLAFHAKWRGNKSSVLLSNASLNDLSNGNCDAIVMELTMTRTGSRQYCGVEI